MGPDKATGLPLAATMGRLAGKSLRPEGACSEHDAGPYPAPTGLRWHAPSPTPWQSRSQMVDPVSLLDLMPSIILSVAQAVKLVNFQRPAPPQSNSVSRTPAGSTFQNASSTSYNHYTRCNGDLHQFLAISFTFIVR